MADRLRARHASNGLPICTLLAASALAASAAGLCTPDAAAALPLLQPPAALPAAAVLLIDERPAPGAAAPADAGPELAPFAGLNEALAATRARLEELSKAAAVAAAAGQVHRELETVKQENKRLLAEAAVLRATRDQLRNASQGAEARIAELTKAVEDAAGEAKRIEEEMVAMRWQNAQLGTSLARAESDREALQLEARKTQDALAIKVETLGRLAEQSAAEIARLRTELEDTGRTHQIASSARSEAEARLAELRTAVQSAEAKVTHLDDELATARSQLTQAEEERDQARAEIAELQSEAGQLRSALTEAKSEVDRVDRNKGDLQQELALLRSVESSATDVALQNLLVVESRIKELKAVLAGGQWEVQGEAAVGEIAPGAGPVGR